MTTQLKKIEHIFREDIDYNTLIFKIMKMRRNQFITELMDSGLRGSGGAGFPTGLKWKIVKEKHNSIKYIVCNAAEGKPGTFKDKEILEKATEKVIWGMTDIGSLYYRR